NPVRRALAQSTGASPVAMAIALSARLFNSHGFIPPTPGPIASPSNLGLADNLLLAIGLGARVAIPALIGSYFFPVYVGKSLTAPESEVIPDQDVEAAYEELRNSYTRLPSTLTSVLPIIAPIILMAGGSIANMFKWTEGLGRLIVFLGTPMLA